MWAANVVHVRAPIGATRGDKHRLVRRSVRGSLVVEPLGLRTQKTGWPGARCACACVRVRVAYASLCGACGTRWLGYGVVGVRALEAVEGETSKASRQGPPPQERKLATSLGGSKPLAVRGIVPSCLPITRGCGGARTGRVTFGRLCVVMGWEWEHSAGTFHRVLSAVMHVGCGVCWLCCILAGVCLWLWCVFIAVVRFYSCAVYMAVLCIQLTSRSAPARLPPRS